MPTLLRFMLAVGHKREACATWLITWLLALAGAAAHAGEARVLFDIPDKIECRDVTPGKCAAAHPDLKVIEAKFRISASLIEGTETSIVDFAYIVVSPEFRLKIQDFLPNTTLESTAAGDSIEVADTTESSTGLTEDAKVAYKILALGASHSQTAKKTESDKYKQVAPKALVLASGTINREHGVFFKLRPSLGASLEGAKEFTFLAVVPKTWRGDWCTVTCVARTSKKVPFGTATLLAGVEQAHVGLYLSGDHEANALADKLWQVQEANSGVLTKQMNKEAARQFESMHAVSPNTHSLAHYEEWLHNVATHFAANQSDKNLDAAKAAIGELQAKLGKLSGE